MTDLIQTKPINTRVFMEITMEDGSIHQLKEELIDGKWIKGNWECVLEAKNAN
jgi:hypothetical protein